MRITTQADWPANRRLWAEALRDESRKQVTHRLGHQGSGGQCCLGVLAEVAGCEYEDAPAGDCWDDSKVSAPQRAMNFVGLRTENAAYRGSSLAGDNDAGKTFAEIADIIERKPEGLFREGEAS